ncbi:Uncharacterised protein [Porphyromonas macacae]|uniref:Uncharacterized protein n=1 Tax=Porphyromonas macacae TaxID=28115 RepID=A0A379E941_9PORP|nr:hypothetical protein [Porphyromonas macacae]SUB78204.1 Uncharacterised protein [Porphyromonas macacae]SUB89207.1 Uncharacterised protein [Porphyromonas macacae]
MKLDNNISEVHIAIGLALYQAQYEEHDYESFKLTFKRQQPSNWNLKIQTMRQQPDRF